MELDKKDRQILMALQHDARQSLSALGKQIGLSQPAMSERVKKLEDAGVIAGYAARINLAAVGLGLQAVVRVRTSALAGSGVMPRRCCRPGSVVPEGAGRGSLAGHRLLRLGRHRGGGGCRLVARCASRVRARAARPAPAAR